MARKRSPLAQAVVWRVEVLAYDVVAFFLRLLPLDWASALGGWVVGTLGPMTSVHKTVQRNLRIAFPEKSEDERRRIADEAWRQTGRTFAELPLMQRLRPASGRIEVVGRERLEALAREKVPTVFCGGHYANHEVMAALVVETGIDCILTYREANNPLVDRRIVESRRRYGVPLFAPKGADSARELLRVLHRGGAVGFMVDQKSSFGIRVPFFGKSAPTNAGPARLALQANARIQPLSIVRLKGARFRVTLHEPYFMERTGDRKADIEAATRRLSAFIEDRVREHPGQYFWMHRRWGDDVYRELLEGEAAAASVRERGEAGAAP